MIENLENEEWKPIAGYEGLYEISNFSRIKSTKFKIHRILNPNAKITNDTRYIKCRLFNKHGEEQIVRNHRIAAMHFILNPNQKLFNEVNHKDGDRSNNHVSNLEWTNHRENVLHGAITKNKSSKYTGVSYYSRKKSKNWVATCYWNKKHHFIGGYDTEEEAANAYKEFIKKNLPPHKYVV